MPKNENAIALGKLGKGKKKNISDSERENRRKRLAKARTKRWAVKKKK
jgi:hypothetical protein